MAERARAALTMRLSRYLAQAGVASRRASEALIVAGRVRVNGTYVRELGTSVPEGARVEVDGNVVTPQQHEVLVMNKPVGVVTTMRDPEGRKTVGDLLRAARNPKAPRLVPVGRLDYDTSGVLLLTNDGDLAFALTHPRFGVEKLYRVTVRGAVDEEAVRRLRHGIALEGRKTSPARLRVVAGSAGRTVVDLTIHEGRYRQVRRMFESMGLPVVSLQRLRFGPVALGPLRPGEMRDLTPRERKALAELLRTSVYDGRPRNPRRHSGGER